MEMITVDDFLVRWEEIITDVGLRDLCRNVCKGGCCNLPNGKSCYNDSPFSCKTTGQHAICMLWMCSFLINGSTGSDVSSKGLRRRFRDGYHSLIHEWEDVWRKEPNGTYNETPNEALYFNREMEARLRAHTIDKQRAEDFFEIAQAHLLLVVPAFRIFKEQENKIKQMKELSHGLHET